MHGLVATIYIVSTATSGAILWFRITSNRKPSLFELSGVGLVISTITIALLNLIYRTAYTGFSLSSAAFIFCGCILLTKNYPKYKSIGLNQSNSQVLEVSVLGAFVTGYLSALSTYILPLFIAFVVVSVLNIVSSGRLIKWKVTTSSAIIFIGVIASKYLQRHYGQENPSWRWISSDVIYDTSQSVGVGRFGLMDNVFSTSLQNKGYLLTYSWSGDFANLTRLPHIEITTISFAVVALFGIGFCTIAACENLGIPKLAAYIICGSILAQSSFPESNLGGEYLKINNQLTLLWLIGYLVFLIVAKLQKSKTLILATYLLPPIIMFGKFHFGVLAVIIVITATDLISIEKSYPWRLKSVNWFHLSGSICTLLLSFLAFKLLIEFPNRWPNQFPFDSHFWKWSIILFLFRFLGIRLLNFVDWLNLRRIINSLMVFSLFSYVYSNGANNTIYLVSGSIAIASFGMFAVLYMQEEYASKNHLLSYFSLTAISAMISFIAYADYTISYFGFLSSPSGGIKYALYTEYSFLLQPVLVICMVILILFCLMIFGRTDKASKKKLFVKLLVLSVFGSNLGFFLFLPVKPILLNQKYDANEYQIFPVEPQLVEALNFVRLNTPHNAVIASNRLCRADIDSEGRTPDWPPGSLPSCGNVNFLSPVSAISERRQLLEAPAFNNILGPFLDPESVFRYRTILRFFASPSKNDLVIFKNYSVTHLFVDKSLPWSTAVTGYGTVIFENESSVVISV